MSIRTIKTVAVLFFIFVLAGIGLSVSVIRMKHIEATNQFFQTIIPDGEQFAQTYSTMDSGLREKTSQKILAEAQHTDGLHFLVIQDQRNGTLLLWQSPEMPGPSVPSVGVPYIPVIPSSDLWSQVNETSLSGSFRLITWTEILGTDDVTRIGILGLVLLIAFAVFLIVQMLLSDTNESPVEIEKVSDKSSETSRINVVVARTEPSEPPSSAEIVHSNSEVSSAISEIAEKIPRNERDSKDSKFMVLDRKSGVSHEQFLSFRLDKELERSAENVVDLSLALFRFQDIGSQEHSKAAAMVLSEFSHEDLIFEYGADCFCVILPQHDLDQAIARAELLIRKAEGQFGQNTKEPLLTAGLSSRNGRLLDSKRFLKEANTALRKANIREGRIVGFRPDPVRFRNFLRHQRV